MVVGTTIVSSRFAIERKAELISSEFDAHQERVSSLDEQFNGLVTQLSNAARVLNSSIEQNARFEQEYNQFGDESSIIELRYSLLQIPLLSPSKKQNLQNVFDPNVHYVLLNDATFLPLLKLLKESPLVTDSALIADVGNHEFQLASLTDDFDLPLPLMDWLDQNRDRWLNNTEVGEVEFVPPYIYRGEPKNYVVVNVPVTNFKPVYLVLELHSHTLNFVNSTDEKYVLWQTANQRVVASNIDVSQDYSANIQSLLATRYIPSSWHELAFADRLNIATASITSLVENTASPGSQWLIWQSEFKYAPLNVFVFKEANQLVSQWHKDVFVYALQMFTLGGLCLLVFIWVVYTVLFKPFSLLMGYIEQQNSLYELDDVEPPSGWEPWFEKIKNSFSDNRKLFNSLVAKNKELDDKVQERTRALQLQTMQKDRNLALNRAIINSMPDLIYYKNVDGTFVGCNRAFEKFTGVKEADLVTNLVEDVFEADVAAELSKFDFQALKGRRLFSAKVWHSSETSGDVYINWLVSPVVNLEGELLGTVSLGRDITEQETSFRQVEQARNAAESANVAKTEFIANMSHEIRTPMHAILGMIELLNNAQPSPIQKSYLTVAESSSRHMLKVINEILDFSKMNAGKLDLNIEPVDFNEIMDISFANSLSSAMEKELLLDIDLPLDFPVAILADKIRLSQIFTNLINNAVKFTDKGSVVLSAKILAQTDGEYTIAFSVTDTGRGIAKEQQQKVFDAFAQADASTTRQYGGTGLGLAIVFQLVELMDGEITLESELDEGTTVTVTMTLKGHAKNRFSINHLSNWLLFEPKTTNAELLANKLRSAKQLVRVAHSHSELSDSRFDVLICRPELLIMVPDNIIQAIKSGEVEYQPIVFNISHFVSSELDDLPFRQLLSLPFTSWDLINNQDSRVDLTENEIRLDHLDILVVEDNYVNQQVMRMILESSGARVHIAENGLAALRKLNESKYDAVLLDIQMPVMDGLTCARKIRESSQFNNVPILAMTAHSAREDYERSFEAGIDVHLEKPIDKANLLKVIDSYTKEGESGKFVPIPASIGDAEAKKSEVNLSELPVIDKKALLSQFANDENTMQKLLVIFLKSKEQEMSQFVEQLKTQISPDVFAKLHNFQGMLANIRAEKAVEATKRLRIALKQGEKLETTRAIALWQSIITELFGFLRKFD